MPRKTKALGPKAEANRKKFYENPDDPRHGSTNGYGNLGCKCERCTKAWAERHLKYMHEDPDRMRRHAEREMKRRGIQRKRAYKPKPPKIKETDDQ
jgi:hypothetical protein